VTSTLAFLLQEPCAATGTPPHKQSAYHGFPRWGSRGCQDFAVNVRSTLLEGNKLTLPESRGWD